MHGQLVAVALQERMSQVEMNGLKTQHVMTTRGHKLDVKILHFLPANMPNTLSCEGKNSTRAPTKTKRHVFTSAIHVSRILISTSMVGD